LERPFHLQVLAHLESEREEKAIFRRQSLWTHFLPLEKKQKKINKMI
jgi:hypothetical protein